jgi:hypothetical protein
MLILDMLVVTLPLVAPAMLLLLLLLMATPQG